MTFREALDRKPQGLDERHEIVARILFGRPEGVDRYRGAELARIHEREWRQLVSDINASGWLAIVAPTDGREARRYRLAQPGDHDLVNAASREDQSRAVSLHKRARGRLEAFQRMHQVGPLLLAEVEPLEVA